MEKKVEAKLLKRLVEKAQKSDNPKEALSELMFELSRDMFRASDKLLEGDCSEDEMMNLTLEMQTNVDNLRAVTEALKPLYETE